jgi:hypothetical protein
MKVKTNLRAGKQTRSRGADDVVDSSSSPDVVVYVPPVTRCVGI